MTRNGIPLVLIGLVIAFLHFEIPRATTFDPFHDGENLVPAFLFLNGKLPWKDFQFIHGLFQDLINPILGFKLWTPTSWGAKAGVSTFWLPLYWLGIYGLLTRLFQKQWLPILSFLLLPILFPNLIGHNHLRFLFVPWLFFLFDLFLEKEKKWMAVLLGCSCIGVTFIVPEAICATFPILGIALWNRKQIRSLLISSFLATTLIVITLCYFGVMGDFLKTLVGTFGGHQYTGGMPLYPFTLKYSIALITPLLALSYFVLFARNEKLILAFGIFCFFYFHKTLARADWHVNTVFAACYPLICWASWDLLQRSKIVKLSFFGGVGLLTLLILPGKILSKNLSFQIGSDQLLPEQAVSYIPVRNYLQQNLKPGETLFDFSNAPGTFHFLYQIPPASSYTHVSQAIRISQQDQVIAELKQKPPKLVAAYSYSDLGSWDGISAMVRHYKIARYLWGNFVPAMWIEGTFFFKPKGTTPQFTEKVFEIEPCDWGYVPYYAQNWKEWVEDENSFSKHTEIKIEPQKGWDGYYSTFPLASYHWLKLEITPSSEDLFSIAQQSHQGKDLRSRIAFLVKPGKKQTLRVPISSCMQWYYFNSSLVMTWEKSGHLIHKFTLSGE